MTPGSGPSTWRQAALLWWSLTLCFFGLFLLRPAAAEAPIPGEVLVSLSCRSVCGPLIERVAAEVGTLVEAEPRLGVCRLRVRAGLSIEEAMARLGAMPGVAYVEPNVLHEVAALVPNDSLYSSQWAPRQIGADRAWEIWQPRVPVVIAVIDSGIDSTHPDLAERILRDEAGIVGYDSIRQIRDAAMDDFFHGTHVAGIAAARANNGLGIAGITGWPATGSLGADPIKLIPVKALDRNGRGSTLTVSRAITWAADQGAHILNLSLGSSAFTQTLAQAVQYAISRGCVIVAAAGNSGSDAMTYPASLPGVIAVAATDRNDRLTMFSNYGSWVAVAAPGDGIVSTTPTYATGGGFGTNYATVSGTSMACPHVAGEAALLLSQNPNLTARDIERVITRNVDPYRPYNDRRLADGAGRVNVYRALRAVTGGAEGSETFLSTLLLDANTVEGGTVLNATVTLRGATPTSDVTIRLFTNSPSLATVPERVVVPAGKTSATFPITTLPVSTTNRVTISAEFAGGTRTASLELKPAAATVRSIAFSPETLLGGGTVRATILLSDRAPREGLVIELSSSHPSLVALPATVRALSGATSIVLNFKTYPVREATEVRIEAVLGAARVDGSVTLTPPSLVGLVVRPNLVRGPRTVSAQLVLNAPAPAGGLRVTLSSSDPESASVPAEVLVPAGATSVIIPVNAARVSVPTRVEITGIAGGVSQSSSLWVLGGP